VGQAEEARGGAMGRPKSLVLDGSTWRGMICAFLLVALWILDASSPSVSSSKVIVPRARPLHVRRVRRDVGKSEVAEVGPGVLLEVAHLVRVGVRIGVGVGVRVGVRVRVRVKVRVSGSRPRQRQCAGGRVAGATCTRAPRSR
jgi:hypothetical protein